MKRPSDLPENAPQELRRLHAAGVRGVQLANAEQAKVDARKAEVQKVLDRYERDREHFVQRQLPLDLDTLMAAEQRRDDIADLR